MGVESDEILDSHGDKVLEHLRAVQRFSLAAAELPALVEIGHDHRDPPGFPADCGDRPLQVHIVVVRRHVIGHPAQVVGNTVVADVKKDVEVVAADGIQDDGFSFSAAEAGCGIPDQITVPCIGVQLRSAAVFVIAVLPPLNDVVIYLLSEDFAALKRYDPQIADGHSFSVSFLSCLHENPPCSL